MKRPCTAPSQAEPTEWSRNILSETPHPVETAAEWSPEEIYRIIEDRIKMSGMPAFGPHHEQDEIAALTAFVSMLPGLSSGDYVDLAGGDRACAHELAVGNAPETERDAEAVAITDP